MSGSSDRGQQLATGSPTPEALLGMLGKLKRTLTKNASEERQSAGETDYIPAATLSSGPPNLLRPSPGLDVLPQGKTAFLGNAALDRGHEASALQLESAAPPMDLDRSLRRSDTSASSAMPSVSTTMAGSTPAPSQTQQVPAAAQSSTSESLSNQSSAKPHAESALSAGRPEAQEHHADSSNVSAAPGSSHQAPPDSAALIIKVIPHDTQDHQKPVQATIAEASSAHRQLPLDSVSSNQMSLSEAETMQSAATAQLHSSALAAQGSTPVGAQGSQEHDSESTRQEPLLANEQPEPAESITVAKEGLPFTEEGLDSAMQALAAEVSQLQPCSPAPASQGSYLQRHTSSLILKMAQDAAVPPLPAVANLAASPKHDAAPAEVRRPAKVGDEQRDVKKVAAQLFRAFDEGRLRERAAAPADQTGPSASHDMSASIRTYKPAPHAKREAVTSPPVRTSSYATRQKATPRRSLSPNIGRKSAALSARPGWDATTSPRHARHAAAEDMAQVAAIDLVPNSLASPQRAQHADLNPGRLNRPTQQGAAQQGQGHLLQGQQPQPASPAAALAPSHVTSSVISGSTPVGASFDIHLTKGRVVPSPPRFRRLPASSLADRPPWTSPLQHKGKVTAQPAQLLSQQSTGTRTMNSTSQRQSGHRAGQTSDGVTSSAAQVGGVAPHVATPNDYVSPTQLASLGRSGSLASAASHADFLTDAHAQAHAQALQRLQQAVEEYNSSSPNVLVPAAVELTHALRQAARQQGPPRQSVESLQLAGLKLNPPAEQKEEDPNVPSPWPEWVRGAWGSPHGTPQAVLPPIAAMASQADAMGQLTDAAVDPSHAVVQTTAALAQHAQRDAQHGMTSSHGHDWSPAKQPSEAGRARNALVRRALAEAEAAAARQALEKPRQFRRHTQDKAQPTVKAARPSAGSSRASATPPRASATPPRASAKPSRASATPPRQPAGLAARSSRAAAASDRAVPSGPGPSRRAVANGPSSRAVPNGPSSRAAVNRASPQASRARRLTATNKDASKVAQEDDAVMQSMQAAKQQSLHNRQVGDAHRRSSQPTSVMQHGLQGDTQPAPLGSETHQPTESSMVMLNQPYAADWQERQPANSIAQGRQTATHPGVAGIHDDSIDTEAAMPLLMQLADHQLEQPENMLTAHEHDGSETPDLSLGSESHLSPHAEHAEPSPARSMTSVAALRQSFEQRSSPSLGLVDSLKPRNRVPLRKVSSKAHVMPDDGSPQQAVLLWQQSLRGEGEDSAAEPHAEAQHAQHGPESRKLFLEGRYGEGTPSQAEDGGVSRPALHHTMSSLVSQKKKRPVPTPLQPTGVQQGSASDAHANDELPPSPRLTAAALATAARELRVSAEQLPVSHRLPVSRSVFDSDEGSLVSSDGHDGDDKGTSPANREGSSAQPLAEEATLALLPDRGMSPVSESAEGHTSSASGQNNNTSEQDGPPLQQKTQETSSSSDDCGAELYAWRNLAWAHGPSWVRVICRLAPSPPPHFVHPQGPHILQTELDARGADAKNYAFDQVLLDDCSQEEVAAQAAGLVGAVLQGRNSVALALGQPGSGKTHTMHGCHQASHSAAAYGVSTLVVQRLFQEMQDKRTPARVQSVYMTAFQILGEAVQDLLHNPALDVQSKQQRSKGARNSDRHDVFVDKQNRTWVSNLAALQIRSLSEFTQLLSLMSSRRHCSDSPSHSSHGPSSCIVTLLVVADIPSDSAPSSAKRPRHTAPKTAQSQKPAAVSRICSKLSFVEVGSSAASNEAQPARTVSAGPLLKQLSRSSTTASVASSFARCSSAGSRRQAVAPGRAVASGSPSARGKAQDPSMRAISEVVWASAHGKGVPVPNRACKLTRYLQDTLCPSGRAVAVMCISPSADTQTQNMPTLAASERMMSS